MAFSGYYVYRGVGGLADVDYDTAVGTVTGAGASIAMADLGHLANTTYTYVLRAVKADIENPDVSACATVVMDGDADWEGNKPAPVVYVEADVEASGHITLRWKYHTGSTAAADFGVYYRTDPRIVLGSPDATETFTRDKTYTEDLTLVDGTAYWFAVTARTAGGVESLPVQIGPYIADSTAPGAPALTATAVWKP